MNGWKSIETAPKNVPLITICENIISVMEHDGIGNWYSIDFNQDLIVDNEKWYLEESYSYDPTHWLCEVPIPPLEE